MRWSKSIKKSVIAFGLNWYYCISTGTTEFPIHKKHIFCNSRQDSNMLDHWDKENSEIGVGHFEKWPSFCFNRHRYVKTDITGFLIHDSTSLVTKIMILRQLETEIGWR